MDEFFIGYQDAVWRLQIPKGIIRVNRFDARREADFPESSISLTMEDVISGKDFMESTHNEKNSGHIGLVHINGKEGRPCYEFLHMLIDLVEEGRFLFKSSK